jgi:pimeloyl-ACP methyl ester carboxylesterase
MHVETYGSGNRRFIAFHGWGGDHREFAALAARMPPDACLVSVDLPGYGQSPAPESWTSDAMVAGIIRAVEPLNNATLVGFCSGAVIAMLVARARADGIRRIVMIDPFAFVPWYFRIFLAGWVGRQFYRASFASPVGRWVTDRLLKMRKTPDDDFMGAFARVNHDTTLRYLKWFNGIRLEDFRTLNVPTDIYVGASTFNAVRESVRRYRALWPHVQTRTLEGVGHLPLVKGARTLAKLIFA